MFTLIKDYFVGYVWQILAVAGLGLAAVAVCAALYYRGAYLTEAEAHKGTQKDLRAALFEGRRWQTAAITQESNVVALRQNAQACLEREARAAHEARELEEIFNHAVTRPASAGQEVIDNATRRKLVENLNRPLP